MCVMVCDETTAGLRPFSGINAQVPRRQSPLKLAPRRNSFAAGALKRLDLGNFRFTLQSKLQKQDGIGETYIKKVRDSKKVTNLVPQSSPIS